MQGLADEPGKQAPAAGGRQHAEHRGDGQQGQDDEAGAAVEVPQQGAVGESRSCGVLLVGRPAAGAEHEPRSVTRRAVTRVALEPGRGSVAEHDRGRAGRVGADGGGAEAGQRHQISRRGRAGARVQQVVVRRAAAGPAAYAGARGRQRPRLEARPARRGRRAARETETDQASPSGRETARSPPTLTMRRRPQLAGEGGGDQVGGEGLPGGAEVEGGACRHPDGVVGEPDLAPRGQRRGAAGGARRRSRPGCRSRGRSPRRPAAGPAAGGPGRRSPGPRRRRRDGRDQERVDLGPAPGVSVGTDQVGVVAETAAGAVDLGQHAPRSCAGPGRARRGRGSRRTHRCRARRTSRAISGPARRCRRGRRGRRRRVERRRMVVPPAVAAGPAGGVHRAPADGHRCRRGRTYWVCTTVRCGRGRKMTRGGTPRTSRRAIAASYVALARGRLGVGQRRGRRRRAPARRRAAGRPSRRTSRPRSGCAAAGRAVTEETPRRKRSRLRGEGVMASRVARAPPRGRHRSFKFTSWSPAADLTTGLSAARGAVRPTAAPWGA